MFFSSSCATLLTGSTESVTIDSTPQGAEVLVNGFSEGLTPLTFDLDKSFLARDADIKLKADGYETHEFKFPRKFNPITLLNLFNGGIGLWVDFYSTGAIYELEGDEYLFELEKQSHPKNVK